jgi:hypothetical protein
MQIDVIPAVAIAECRNLAVFKASGLKCKRKDYFSESEKFKR